MRPLQIKKANTASPKGQKRMKPRTMMAIHAGRPLIEPCDHIRHRTLIYVNVFHVLDVIGRRPHGRQEGR